MQTVAVKLSGYDTAHALRLLSPKDTLDFYHHLFNTYGSVAEMVAAFERAANEAAGYSDEAKKSVDIMRDAFNSALSLEDIKKLNRQAA